MRQETFSTPWAGHAGHPDSGRGHRDRVRRRRRDGRRAPGARARCGSAREPPRSRCDLAATVTRCASRPAAGAEPRPARANTRVRVAAHGADRPSEPRIGGRLRARTLFGARGQGRVRRRRVRGTCVGRGRRQRRVGRRCGLDRVGRAKINSASGSVRIDESTEEGAEREHGIGERSGRQRSGDVRINSASGDIRGQIMRTGSRLLVSDKVMSMLILKVHMLGTRSRTEFPNVAARQTDRNGHVQPAGPGRPVCRCI